MKKIWLIALLVTILSTNICTQAATNQIQVLYNNQEVELYNSPVTRHENIWIPITTLSKLAGLKVRYDKNESMVYVSLGKGEIGTFVAKANSPEDNGYCPILLNGKVYFNLQHIEDYLKRTVIWDKASKKVVISSIVNTFSDSPDTPEGQLKYDVDNGDFYNGKVKIANLPFGFIDILSADKAKTVRKNVLYTVCNTYGEPHINYELYSVYRIGNTNHIAKSYCWGMGTEARNAMIKGNTVTLIDKNEIKVYDDTTGKVLKSHLIDTTPLKEYLTSNDDAELVSEILESALMGYMLEAVGDDFVLYRNYMLNTLTYVNLNTNEEIELYKEVYPADVLSKVEEYVHSEGDGLKFIKADKDKIYLKQVATNQTYTYVY